MTIFLIAIILILALSLGAVNINLNQINFDEVGKVEHSFSVSSDKKVQFATGNLQYNPAQNVWKFADESYEYLGDDNLNVGKNYDGFIDLFGWGATGYGSATPTNYNDDSSTYGNGANDIAGTEYDFGIYAKDQIGEGWRMFTHDEIHYLLMYRKNAKKLFGYGTIGETRGLFLLPDDWELPEGMNFAPATEIGFENQYDWYYTSGDNYVAYLQNNYTVEEWNKLEDAGAVFLPAGGIRFGTEMYHVSQSGHYWTSSHYGAEFANCLCLFEKDLFLEGNFDRNSALSVRLVREV